VIAVESPPAAALCKNAVQQQRRTAQQEQLDSVRHHNVALQRLCKVQREALEAARVEHAASVAFFGQQAAELRKILAAITAPLPPTQA
jgi:hypothetical protein